ncbi:MAG: thioredoxin family protein [Anaerolineae bacterium]|nr:thioredoxin family protein [Anaerolineae bacterium]
MAATPSTMLPLGTSAPLFTLPDTVSGDMISLADVKSDKANVVMFICNHCPYVKHINSQLVQLAQDYLPKGVSILAINSNDIVSHPGDAPDKMKEVAESLGYPFPYLFDETQEIARAYQAACTPDLFLFDGDLQLVYRGQFDASRPGNNVPVTGQDLRAALDAVLSDEQPDSTQIPSMGCNIKWK